MSLLYKLVEHNTASLITTNQSVRSCFEVESERYGTPFLATVAIESIEAILAFVDALHTDVSPKSLGLRFLPRPVPTW